MYDRLFTTRIKMIVQNFPRFAQIRIQHFYYYTCKNQDKYLMKTYQNTRKIVFICDVFVFGDLSCPHQHSYTKTHIKGHLITPKTFWPHTFFIFTNSFMNYIRARSFFTSSKLTRIQITVSDYEKNLVKEWLNFCPRSTRNQNDHLRFIWDPKWGVLLFWN